MGTWHLDPRTEKIGAACFGAGIVTMLALLIMVPALGLAGLIIGTLLGAGLGYLGYEFRQVLRAIPVAMNAAAPVVFCHLKIFFDLFREFTSKPRPFFYLTLLITLIVWGSIHTPRDAERLPEVLVYAGAFLLGWGVLFFITGPIGTDFVVFSALTKEITRQKWAERFYLLTEQDVDRFFHPDPFFLFSSFSWRNTLELCKDAFLNITYDLGIGTIALVRVIWLGPRVIARFAWTLFHLIHSSERLVSAVDGPAGALLTYLALLRIYGPELTALPTFTQFLFVALGGAVSLLIGMVNYELLSKRVLRVVPMRVEMR